MSFFTTYGDPKWRWLGGRGDFVGKGRAFAIPVNADFKQGSDLGAGSLIHWPSPEPPGVADIGAHCNYYQAHYNPPSMTPAFTYTYNNPPMPLREDLGQTEPYNHTGVRAFPTPAFEAFLQRYTPYVRGEPDMTDFGYYTQIGRGQLVFTSPYEAVGIDYPGRTAALPILAAADTSDPVQGHLTGGILVELPTGMGAPVGAPNGYHTYFWELAPSLPLWNGAHWTDPDALWNPTPIHAQGSWPVEANGFWCRRYTRDGDGKVIVGAKMPGFHRIESLLGSYIYEASGFAGGPLKLHAMNWPLSWQFLGILVGEDPYRNRLIDFRWYPRPKRRYGFFIGDSYVNGFRDNVGGIDNTLCSYNSHNPYHQDGIIGYDPLFGSGHIPISTNGFGGYDLPMEPGINIGNIELGSSGGYIPMVPHGQQPDPGDEGFLGVSGGDWEMAVIGIPTPPPYHFKLPKYQSVDLF